MLLMASPLESGLPHASAMKAMVRENSARTAVLRAGLLFRSTNPDAQDKTWLSPLLDAHEVAHFVDGLKLSEQLEGLLHRRLFCLVSHQDDLGALCRFVRPLLDDGWIDQYNTRWGGPYDPRVTCSESVTRP